MDKTKSDCSTVLQHTDFQANAELSISTKQQTEQQTEQSSEQSSEQKSKNEDLSQSVLKLEQKEEEKGDLKINIGDLSIKPSNKAIKGGQGSIQIYKQAGQEFVAKYIRQKDDFLQEVSMLEKVKEQQEFVQIKGHYVQEGDPKFKYVILMEKLSKNLYDFAGKRGAGFDLQSVKDITLNILRGVQKLHSQNITHYDLKPENVLFIQDGFKIAPKELKYEQQRSLWKQKRAQFRIPIDKRVKIIDLGFAQASPSLNGTQHYISPEILINEIQNNRKSSMLQTITNKTDIWSLGIMIVELYSSYLVFEGDDSFVEQLAKMIFLSNNIQQINQIGLITTPKAASNIFENSEIYSIPDFIAKTIPKRYLNQIQKHLNELVKDSDSLTPTIEALKTISNRDNKFYILISDMLQLDPEKRISSLDAISLLYCE